MDWESSDEEEFGLSPTTNATVTQEEVLTIVLANPITADFTPVLEGDGGNDDDDNDDDDDAALWDLMTEKEKEEKAKAAKMRKEEAAAAAMASANAHSLANAAEVRGKVVMVERCASKSSTATSFADRDRSESKPKLLEKVRRCVAAGARAVIVMNTDQEVPGRIFGFHCPSPIPVLLISAQAGYDLRMGEKRPFRDRVEEWEKEAFEQEQRDSWQERRKADRLVKKKQGRIATKEEKAREKAEEQEFQQAEDAAKARRDLFKTRNPNSLVWSCTRSRSLTELDVSECCATGEKGLAQDYASGYPHWFGVRVLANSLQTCTSLMHLQLNSLPRPRPQPKPQPPTASAGVGMGGMGVVGGGADGNGSGDGGGDGSGS